MRGAIPVSGRLNPTWAIKPGAITFHSIEGSLSFAHTLSRKMVEKKAKKVILLLSEVFQDLPKYKPVFLKRWNDNTFRTFFEHWRIFESSWASAKVATKTLCLSSFLDQEYPIHWLLFNHKQNTIFEKQTASSDLARLKSKQSVLRDNPMVERKQRMMMMVTSLSVPAQPHCEATTTSVLSVQKARRNTYRHEGLLPGKKYSVQRGAH